MSHYSRAQNRKSFFKICGKKFDFETDEEQDTILKLLPLFRLNFDFINEEDIDPEFLDSILSNPKMSFRILKFLGISLKGRSRLARTLRFHFYKLKERHEQKYGMYYWYDDAVKRLHDFMKQELDDQRWLEFMQDLRQDQLNHIVCFAFFSRDSGSTGGALFPRAWSFLQARASGERVR